MRIERLQAIAILQLCKIPIPADYHTLDNDTVLSLLDCAKEAKYRKPKNANGSTGRYFHDYLQRQAAMKF